jgi:DNA-binding response OmpR family regulator
MAKITILVDQIREHELESIRILFARPIEIAVEEGKEITFGSVTYNHDERKFFYQGTEIPMVYTPKRVLVWMFMNPNKLRGRDEFLDIAYEMGSDTNLRNVDTIIRKMRRSLKDAGAIDVVEMIQTVYGEGYRFSPK